MEAVQVHSRTFPPRPSITRDEQFGWCVSVAGGELLAVDEHLEDLARFKLPSDAIGVHGVRPDLGACVVSCHTRVALVDRSGSTAWEVSHPGWGGDSERGSAWFSADGQHVWAHVPTERDPDEWLLLNAASGAITGRSQLRCYSAGSDPIRHPDGEHIGLSVGEGQDGSETYFGRVEGGVPVVERFDDRSRVLAGFSQDGRFFLTTPHTDSAASVHRFPDGDVVARLEPDAALGPGDAFNFFGGFVGEDRVVLTSATASDVFLARAPYLTDVESMQLPMRRPDNLLVAISGGFLTSDWTTGETILWRLID